MTAKEYLMQVNKIDRDIDVKLEQLDSLYALATKATTVLSDIPKSSGINTCRMEDTIVKIMDLETEINDEIDKLVDLKREIMDLIGSIDNIDYRIILASRYINGKQWTEIAKIAGYERRYLLKLHDLALADVNEKLKKQKV
jgi:DNA-directed RNA polymerase specialized sigma subunit